MSPVGIKVYDITSFSIQIWHDMVLYHCNITLLDMWEQTEAIFCQSPISRPPPIYSVGRNAPARVNRSNVLVQRTVRWRTIFISFIIFIFIIFTCNLLMQLSVHGLHHHLCCAIVKIFNSTQSDFASLITVVLIKGARFRDTNIVVYWNGGSTENSVLMKSKKSIKLAIPADSYIGWCRRRVKHKSHVSVTRLKCQSQSHRSHICLWPVECVYDNLPLSLNYIYSFAMWFYCH